MSMKERIIQVRKVSGLNQEAFARRIGVTKSAISGYETGRREPSQQVLHSISREFRFNLKWLRTGDGNPQLPGADGSLEALFHQFSCSELERAFLESYFELQADERAQFCSYLKQVFGATVQDAAKRAEQAHDEMSNEQLHAELDRQIGVEKGDAEKSEVS